MPSIAEARFKHVPRGITTCENVRLGIAEHIHRMRRIKDITPSIFLLCLDNKLERMCYIQVNIAEEVVFTVEGDLVRHRALDHNQDEEEA